MGGENQPRRSRLGAVSGSSPHGRGKRLREQRAARRVRLIPAWAGKTAPNRPTRPGWAAHPRMGGENAGPPRRRVRPRGSSPHGRGKPRAAGCPRPRGRLIPAWAGKTRTPARSASAWPAHPRMGGENVVGGRVAVEGEGSSPHGRGKLSPRWKSETNTRLIPAWAGKTIYVDWATLSQAAHPRMGGENPRNRHSKRVAGGSSPHGRGKQGLSEREHGGYRLIPAWAGKT